MADPTTSPAQGGLPFVARIIGGIVVVAVIVGIGLWAEGRTDDDLALPDRVAGLDADESPKGRDFDEENSAKLSEAYDDADAVTRRYGVGTDSAILVSAVRATSGPPVPGVFSDTQEWVEDDDVNCLVTRLDVATTALCQRTGGDLTVRVLVLGAEGPEVDELVDATNDVWEEVS
jgi:hypothetical protein